MSDVTAIVFGPADGPAPGPAVATGQEVVRVPSLDAVTAASRAATTSRVWLLDVRAQPTADTLAVMSRHADATAVSLPVDEAGAPVEPLLVGFAHRDVELLLGEAQRHRVPLRHAYVLSLLADRRLVADADPPRTARFGRHAGLEWTARLFASVPGVLVPDSRVRVGAWAPPTVLHAARLMRAGVWGRGDVARELRRALGGGR
jgi:hypothetical protein